MAWSFGDSFDLYAAGADMANGYWDSVTTPASLTFVVGRFSGSQAVQIATSIGSPGFAKSSGVNDAVHHFVVSFRQTAAISGTVLGLYIELFDGATAQCSIVFRSDGAILLTSGSPAGTVLATYTGAVPVVNTWYAFEIEVSINNTTGVFNVRKNGNSSNDFSATALNTRGGTSNNYANKIQIGNQASVNAHQIDDLFWQSGAATGTWLGDIRCYARMPASDQSVAFTQSASVVSVNPGGVGASTNTSLGGSSHYQPFTALCNGTIGAVTMQCTTAATANFKCSLFASSGSVPTTVIASATTVTNPALGLTTWTFSSPPSVVQGTSYYIGFCADVSSGGFAVATSPPPNFAPLNNATTYASFPAANPPATSVGGAYMVAINITPIGVANAPLTAELQEDGLTTYVYSSTVNQADFYGVGSIASTPATVIATTTRAYMQKSDAGTRTAAVQLKSGAATVASPTLTLSSSGWLWAWRTDLTDPATGAAWTPAAVNNAQIGPTVVA